MATVVQRTRTIVLGDWVRPLVCLGECLSLAHGGNSDEVR